jgi:hypothetical protein
MKTAKLNLYTKVDRIVNQTEDTFHGLCGKRITQIKGLTSDEVVKLVDMIRADTTLNPKPLNK